MPVIVYVDFEEKLVLWGLQCYLKQAISSAYS